MGSGPHHLKKEGSFLLVPCFSFVLLPSKNIWIKDRSRELCLDLRHAAENQDHYTRLCLHSGPKQALEVWSEESFPQQRLRWAPTLILHRIASGRVFNCKGIHTIFSYLSGVKKIFLLSQRTPLLNSLCRLWGVSWMVLLGPHTGETLTQNFIPLVKPFPGPLHNSTFCYSLTSHCPSCPLMVFTFLCSSIF